MVLDSNYAKIDMPTFMDCDWSQFYHDVKQPFPPNAPQPLGKEVDLWLYMDLDHASDLLDTSIKHPLFGI